MQRDDDPAPATKGDLVLVKEDLALAKGELKAEMGELKTDVSELKTDVVQLKIEMGEVRVELSTLRRDMNDTWRKIHASIDDVLTVLINIDKKLTGKVDDHERRIVKLEDHVALAA